MNDQRLRLRAAIDRLRRALALGQVELAELLAIEEELGRAGQAPAPLAVLDGRDVRLPGLALLLASDPPLPEGSLCTVVLGVPCAGCGGQHEEELEVRFAGYAEDGRPVFWTAGNPPHRN